MRIDFTAFGRSYYAVAYRGLPTQIVNDCGEDVTGTDMRLTVIAAIAVAAELQRLGY